MLSMIGAFRPNRHAPEGIARERDAQYFVTSIQRRGGSVMDRRTFVGGLLVLPLAAVAQQRTKLYHIGYLSPDVQPPQNYPIGDPFYEGLRALGYVEGQNIVVEWRYANGRFERLPELAAELVNLPVAVIVTEGPGPLRAAIDATKTIPIVMVGGSNDPVGDGLVASLARPGGNLTGLTVAVSSERFGKQLELLKEAIPGISRIAVWWDGDLALFHQLAAIPLESAAHKLGLALQSPVQVRDANAIDDAFARFKQQDADALFIFSVGHTFTNRARIAATALHNRLPTVSALKGFTAAGGLLSYGPDFDDVYRHAAGYVDRILKGAKAGDLAIELPRKYELVINVKTSRALGITIPKSLLVRADEVIQ
jgi:putative tryptophan/tyrosine transport system substrate-binding protein